jgi:hypothetical protein
LAAPIRRALRVIRRALLTRFSGGSPYGWVDRPAVPQLSDLGLSSCGSDDVVTTPPQPVRGLCSG